MRVVNDNKQEEKTAGNELGFVAVASYSFLTALGIATVILGPLPMILSHIRLSDPWPKVSALLGAVLALALLDVPLPFVILVFVFGLFVSDTFGRVSSFWKLLALAFLVSVGLGVGILLTGAHTDKVSLLAYWGQGVDSLVKDIQSAVTVDKSFKWEMMRALLFYEGPFLYLSAAILSVWLSVGAVAHMGWLTADHPFSSESLRRLRLPRWVSIAFLALFVAVFSSPTKFQYLFSGVFRLAGALMFIQGCIFLSEVLSRKMVQPRSRTFIYSAAILIGFYALMGVGVVSPWILKNREKLEERS